MCTCCTLSVHTLHTVSFLYVQESKTDNTELDQQLQGWLNCTLDSITIIKMKNLKHVSCPLRPQVFEAKQTMLTSNLKHNVENEFKTYLFSCTECSKHTECSKLMLENFFFPFSKWKTATCWNQSDILNSKLG